MKAKIPPFKYYFPPTFKEKVLGQISQILDEEQFLTMGIQGEKLEENFVKKIGVDHAVAVNTGTSALEIIFQGFNLHNCEVLVPTNTFTATITPLLRINAKPVFIDCDKNLCMNINEAMEKTTPDTKAIVIVHIGGYIHPDINVLVEFCKKRNIILIEDAAHALGSTFQGRQAGTFGDAAAFSFFSTKIMTSGEGGMLVTKHSHIAEAARIIRNQGQEIDNVINSWGMNFRLHEFLAVMANEQFILLDEMISKRRKVKEMYDRSLSAIDGVTYPQEHTDVKSNLYKHIIMTDRVSSRETLVTNMWEKFGIRMAGFVYPIPCHKQRIFDAYNKLALPVSESLCREHLCLPIYPDMSEDKVKYVCESLISLLD